MDFLLTLSLEPEYTALLNYLDHFSVRIDFYPSVVSA